MPCRLIITDVDGTLTDGTVYLDAEGKEVFKAWNTHDGWAILTSPVPVVLASGKHSPLVEARAAQLNAKAVPVVTADKLAGVKVIAESYEVPLSDVAYLGDDWPDVPVLEAVGYPIVPCSCSFGTVYAREHGFAVTEPGGSGAFAAAIRIINHIESKEVAHA